MWVCWLDASRGRFSLRPIHNLRLKRTDQGLCVQTPRGQVLCAPDDIGMWALGAWLYVSFSVEGSRLHFWGSVRDRGMRRLQSQLVVN